MEQGLEERPIVKGTDGQCPFFPCTTHLTTWIYCRRSFHQRRDLRPRQIMRFMVTITDREEIRRVFSAVFGEHYLTFSQKLGNALAITFGVAFPIVAFVAMAESLSPFWKHLAWVACGGFVVFAVATAYDGLQMRGSVTRSEICRSSPFGWLSWSMPVTAVSMLRVRSCRQGLIVTVADANGRKRSFQAPPSLAWNLGPASGLNA